MARFTCISIRSSVGGRDTRRPEDEPSSSKHEEDIKNLKIKIRI